MPFTESVRSFHVPATPGTFAWPPNTPSVPTSRATRVTSEANPLSWSTMVLMVFLSSSTSPLASAVIFRLRSPLATAVVTSAMFRTCDVRLLAIEITSRHRRGDVGDVSHLAGEVTGHEVHRVGQVLPRTGHARHVGLSAQPP